jgi:hypothetical protein
MVRGRVDLPITYSNSMQAAAMVSCSAEAVARIAVQVEGKGEMHTFLLMPANSNTLKLGLKTEAVSRGNFPCKNIP